jgi:hypothetical protein
MLSDATPRNKGKIFGFHRSMDTLGAVLSFISNTLLYFYPENYTTCFTLRSFLTFAIATLLLKEKRTVQEKRKQLLILVLGY